MRFRSSGFCPGAALPVAIQAVEELGVARGCRRGLIHDDNIDPRELALVVAKRLANDSLDAVARRGTPAMFLGYGQAEPGGFRCIWATEHGEKLVSTASCPLEDPPEVGRVEKPVVFTKPVGRRACQSGAFARRRDGRRVCYGVSRARPLARRRFRTRRPALVAIRARKPCVRARLILLGWYVRFMAFPGTLLIREVVS